MSEKKTNSISASSVAYKPSKTRKPSDPLFCTHPGCKIKLSIYNLTNFCSVHESENFNIKNSI